MGTTTPSKADTIFVESAPSTARVLEMPALDTVSCSAQERGPQSEPALLPEPHLCPQKTTLPPNWLCAPRGLHG